MASRDRRCHRRLCAERHACRRLRTRLPHFLVRRQADRCAVARSDSRAAVCDGYASNCQTRRGLRLDRQHRPQRAGGDRRQRRAACRRSPSRPTRSCRSSSSRPASIKPRWVIASDAKAAAAFDWSGLPTGVRAAHGPRRPGARSPAPTASTWCWPPSSAAPGSKAPGPRSKARKPSPWRTKKRWSWPATW